MDGRISSFQGDKYLSISADTVIEESNENICAVPQLMSEDQLFPEKTISVKKIEGANEIQRYACCKNCRRKLGELESEVSVCEICGLHQIVSRSDKKHFSVGICVEGESSMLRVLQEQFCVLIKYYNKDKDASTSLDLLSCKDSDITKALLSLRDLKVTYNTKTKLVRSISC